MLLVNREAAFCLGDEWRRAPTREPEGLRCKKKKRADHRLGRSRPTSRAVHWERMNVETTALLGACRSICFSVVGHFRLGGNGPTLSRGNGSPGCRDASRGGNPCEKSRGFVVSMTTLPAKASAPADSIALFVPVHRVATTTISPNFAASAKGAAADCSTHKGDAEPVSFRKQS